MKSYAPLLAVLGAIAYAAPTAAADIYKCTDEDGNVAYLQLPCPAKKAADPAAVPEQASEQAPEEVLEEAPEEAMPAPGPAPSSRLGNESLDACKKRYRDQIDAIDAELSDSWSDDEAENYKDRLRALTQQLRACG